MDFDYYRDLLVFARDQRIPVIGLNAEKSLVKAVGEKPLAELTPQEREALPEMDFSDPYQKALVESIYGGHAHGGNLEGFLRVQTLWDETMAASVARYLQGHEGDHMVVLAGGNHIRFGFGIPRRVFRRLPTSYVLVGSQEIDIPESMQDRLMDVVEPQFPMVPYDFLAYTRYEELARPPVRLGVSLEEKEGGKIEVEAVTPGSVAEQVGIRKGDRILAVDGTPVSEAFDVVYAVRQKHPGDRMKLQIERDGRTIMIETVFPPSEKKPAAS